MVGGSVWYSGRAGATCVGTGQSETEVAGELAREINAEAAAVSDGAGAGGTCVGQSLSDVTMRCNIVTEASSGTTGEKLTVSVESTGIGGTIGVGSSVEGSWGECLIDVNQLKAWVRIIASKIRMSSPNHRIKGREGSIAGALGVWIGPGLPLYPEIT